MNSDIRFLQQLEDDLREAAAREAAAPPKAATRSGASSRRLPRRERHWGAVAAALVALLVVAGSIGFLTQLGGSSNDSSSRAVADSVGGADRQQDFSVPGIPVPAAPSPAPNPAPGFQTALDARNADLSESAGSGGDKTTSSGSGSTAPQTDLSKIIRDGRIGIQLPDGAFSQNVFAVTRIARNHGGMVLDAATENESSGTFTLRIPAKHFDDVMLQLRALGGVEGAQILYQDATGQDVTADFVDLQARLSILKGTKERLVGLQAQATSVNEILSLGSQIDQVQLQIEQIQGQINLINDQVAESTIKVALREQDAPTDPGQGIDNPSLSSAWDRALQGFLRVLGAVIVGLGYLIPLALIGGAIWGVVTLVRKRRRAAS
jgi:hypothetical protein